MLSLWRQPGGDAFEIVVVTDDPAPLRALIGDPPQLQYLIFPMNSAGHGRAASAMCTG